MQRPRLAALILLPLLLLPLSAQPALRPGEALTYRVGWGSSLAPARSKSSPRLRRRALRPATSSTSLPPPPAVSPAQLYAFDARAEALVDEKTGRLISHVETSTTKQRNTRHVTTFDYAKRIAFYRDEINAAKNLDFALPPGEPLDLIMSLINTRAWDLKPGDKRDALVLFEEEAYELTIHAVRYEEVTTRLGTFNTLVLEPRMDKTPPKGMFKKAPPSASGSPKTTPAASP